MRKISLNSESTAALNAEGVKPSKPLSPLVVHVSRKQVMVAGFGLSMTATLRQQLLSYTSFRAIKACWASVLWQRRQRERTRN